MVVRGKQCTYLDWINGKIVVIEVIAHLASEWVVSITDQPE